MSWNPDLYLKFAGERTRPSVDLAARVEVAAARSVIDLGCGPGNSTAIVRARWPSADVTGLDSDPVMIAVAQKSDTGVRWELADAAAWEPADGYDVVFSNALLQWLPDHESLIPKLFRAVNPGGALAVQLPAHTFSPLHQHILAIAGEPGWPDTLRDARTVLTSHEPPFYYDVLCPLTKRLDLWVTEYCHVLDGPDAILTWIRGTGLRPFLQALPDEVVRTRFEAELLKRIEVSYPRRRDGRVLFPFRRLFFIAYREGNPSH